MPETKVTLNNPEDSNSGYTIENPYATKIKFITDAVPEGFIFSASYRILKRIR